ncbi:glycosyltransferase family 2 protein [Cohnella kolymensis]|nr:glycosyltransferase [Cohnella kolymensis]
MADAQSLLRNIKNRRRASLSATESQRKVSYRVGFREGYRQGVQYGIQNYPKLFDGTSIVIATHNQLDMLRQCINSIAAYTNSSYEIIVVDNASTDGTADYLQKAQGLMRSRIMDSHRGLSGALNAGMMMAKGTTIVLMRSETCVTDNWLDNMLVCLNSDDGIGMVSPVTEFERNDNRPDASPWRRTDRLTGYCLLFRRKLFEEAGYFDEGYEDSNFVDDNYSIRVRLLGKSLVIANDACVHNIGGEGGGASADRSATVDDHDRFYFIDKWNNPYEWIHRVRSHKHISHGETITSVSFYPERVAVQGFGANIYWIENGQRRQIEGVVSFPITRISQIDLRRWPVGAPITAHEAERRWRGLGDPIGLDIGIARLPDGASYHVEGGTIRKITSSAAMQAWSLHLKPSLAVSDKMLEERAEGLPIIAPPLLKQPL